MVADHSGDSRCLPLESFDVDRVELTGFPRADVDDAEQAPVGDQRYAEHRADTLFPQDRIDHGVGADLVKRHR